MSRYVIIVVSVLTLSVFAAGSHAQTSPPHHQVAAPKLVDGAVHPELIPDSVAYRLYLVAVSTGQNPTETDQQRQRAHVMKAGLVDIDQKILISILSDFRAKYDALVTEYNHSAKAGNTTDVQGLLRKIDDLVRATRDTISVRLSSTGAAKLHAFVVSEKTNMKMTEED